MSYPKDAVSGCHSFGRKLLKLIVNDLVGYEHIAESDASADPCGDPDEKNASGTEPTHCIFGQNGCLDTGHRSGLHYYDPKGFDLLSFATDA
jgi:hypothetical protein